MSVNQETMRASIVVAAVVASAMRGGSNEMAEQSILATQGVAAMAALRIANRTATQAALQQAVDKAKDLLRSQGEIAY
jgi:hypothetical protein